MEESNIRHEENEDISIYGQWKRGLITIDEINKVCSELSKKNIEKVMSQDFSKLKNLYDYRRGLMDAMTLVSDMNYELFFEDNDETPEIKNAVSHYTNVIHEAIGKLYKITLTVD